MGITERNEVKELFKYPLIEAISRRRTRRFPVGCALERGSMQHKSERKPMPLNDIETAILCWAGAGITGAISGDLCTAGMGNTFGTWVGRAVAMPCNVHTIKLFYTDDNGVFLYDPKKATKPVEIETEADREKIMKYFKEDTRKLQDKRLATTPEGVLSLIQWNSNKPGTTIFMPIVDLTEEYINFLFGVFQDEGYQIFDETTGQPAGIKKWIDKGALKGPLVPMRSFEYFVFNVCIAPAFLAMQNMQLVAEAMGLGSIPTGGYTSIIVLGGTPISKGLGFRFAIDKAGMPTCIGLDGVYETYCPPYKSMNDAVDAFAAKKFGPGAMFTPEYQGVMPFKDWKKVLPGYDKATAQTIEITKAYCNYVYDTYGRFPVTFDAIVMPIWLQVHHLELEWYDKYEVKALVNETQRRHMDLWHK